MATSLYINKGIAARPCPLRVGSVGPFNGLGLVLKLNGTAGFSSSGWPGNNRAIYTPIFMPMRFTVARFMSANNNATGNTDIGLYNDAGNRLLSTGTTARSGAPAMQFIGVADQSFPAGTYYLAMVCSTTSGQVFRATLGFTSDAQGCGVLQEDLGSTVLPVSMTPVAYTGTVVFFYGFTQSDTL